MTGKRYYLTTLHAWQRYANRFSNSHWFALPQAPAAQDGAPKEAQDEAQNTAPRGRAGADTSSGEAAGDAPILVLIEADEGAHLALEDDPAFEPLPHPLAQTPVSERARSALTALRLPSDATTFDVAEAASRFHPLLRHHVF